MKHPDPDKYPSPPEVCPVCGEEVPRNALACRECGADHESGWREDAFVYDGLNLPEDPDDEDFDCDPFLEREFGHKSDHQGFRFPNHIHPLWWITAIFCLLAFVLVRMF